MLNVIHRHNRTHPRHAILSIMCALAWLDLETNLAPFKDIVVRLPSFFGKWGSGAVNIQGWTYPHRCCCCCCTHSQTRNHQTFISKF